MRLVLAWSFRDYINHWNANACHFVQTATAEEIFVKVRLVQTSIKPVDNNAK